MSTATVVIVVIALVALACHVYAQGPNKPDGYPDGPVIVVIEPSIFRRGETYVIGPFPTFGKGWMDAQRAVRRNPHAEARVLPASTTVLLGRRQLWPEVDDADDPR